MWTCTLNTNGPRFHASAWSPGVSAAQDCAQTWCPGTSLNDFPWFPSKYLHTVPRTGHYHYRQCPGTMLGRQHLSKRLLQIIKICSYATFYLGLSTNFDQVLACVDSVCFSARLRITVTGMKSIPCETCLIKKKRSYANPHQKLGFTFLQEIFVTSFFFCICQDCFFFNHKKKVKQFTNRVMSNLIQWNLSGCTNRYKTTCFGMFF